MSFGKNNVAQQLEDDNTRQAFKENENFLKTLYDNNTVTGASLTTFKSSILAKIDLALKDLSSSSSLSDIANALVSMRKTLNEIE